jgi:acyl-CoA thioester hydrolase
MTVVTPGPVLEQVHVFFDDLDAFGMVSNLRYAAMVERGTNAYLGRFGFTYGHEDTGYVVKQFAITFEQPITTMGRVDLALWAETFGRTSAKFGFRFASGQTVHAYGYRTVVKIDRGTFRPAPWTEELRKLVTECMLIPSGSELSIPGLR